jgi:(p)ppGpp synthase/HD superfamily hydrolase
MRLITHAASFAADAHREQTRKENGCPYINHPARVAAVGAMAALPPHAIAAAYLHDVVEDTPVTIEQVFDSFGPTVGDLVDRLTKWWPDDAPRSPRTPSTTRASRPAPRRSRSS